jgi:hypothetical protein
MNITRREAVEFSEQIVIGGERTVIRHECTHSIQSGTQLDADLAFGPMVCDRFQRLEN